MGLLVTGGIVINTATSGDIFTIIPNSQGVMPGGSGGSGGGGTSTIGRYEVTVNLDAGYTRVILPSSSVPTKPYSIQLFDSTGGTYTVELSLIGDTYVLDIYSVDAVTGVTIMILF
jgi:hypothetical protein